MGPGRGEVVVRRDDIAGFGEHPAEEVFGGAALMDVHDMFVPQDVFDGLGEIIERHAARVGVVRVA